MSIQALAWVLDFSEATSADRLVLIAIANHADAKGWNAWPGVPQIAREARVSRATVYRALEALEAMGELLVKRRPGKSSHYGITALMGSHPETPQGVSSCDKGVSSCDSGGLILRPEPSLTVNNPRPICFNCGWDVDKCFCGFGKEPHAD